MPYVSLEEQGAYRPGQVIQDAVANYVQNQIRMAAEQRAKETHEQQQQLLAAQEGRTSTQFGTEQAVRAAGAAPKIDPRVIADEVTAAQLRGGQNVENLRFTGGMPVLPRLAINQGKLPTVTDEEAGFDPTSGAPVTATNTGFLGPNNVFQPFGGSVKRGAPPVSTETTIKAPEEGASATPGLAVVRTQRTVKGPDGKPIVIGSEEKPQRVTPPHGDAALIDMAERLGVDPDDLQAMVTGLVKKKSTPTPQFKSGTPESLQATIDSYTAKLTAATEDEAPALQAAITNLQGRMDALKRQFAPKAPKESMADFMAKGSVATPSAPAPGALQSGASPKGGTPNPGTTNPTVNPRPAPIPASTPAGGQANRPAVSQPGASKFETGKVYKDAKGNRAVWDGQQFIDPGAWAESQR